jgi:hypothetical protein
MPFVSASQEAYMFAYHPNIAREWVHRYGHAKNWSEYQKKHKKNKRKTGKRKTSRRRKK